MPILTRTYRYKRPPRKRAKAAALVASAIVTIGPKTPVAKKGRRQTEGIETAAREGNVTPPAHRSAAAPQSSTKPPQPADHDGSRTSAIVTIRDRKTVQRQREPQQMAKLMGSDALTPTEGVVRRSAIVTARKQGKAIPDGWLPDTPEEHQRRGDAADALWRELVRRASGGE